MITDTRALTLDDTCPACGSPATWHYATEQNPTTVNIFRTYVHRIDCTTCPASP